MKLNLGCGQHKLAGFVNIDKYATCSPDLVWDLEQTPYPFETGSVTEITANHVLEHLGQSPGVFFAIIKELYRVLASGGIINLTVPHYRSDGYWGDPTHVRVITPGGMALFSKKNCRMYAEGGYSNTPLADYLDVDFEIASLSMVLAPLWRQRLDSGEVTRAEVDAASNSQWNVIDEIVMSLRKV